MHGGVLEAQLAQPHPKRFRFPFVTRRATGTTQSYFLSGWWGFFITGFSSVISPLVGSGNLTVQPKGILDRKSREIYVEIWWR